MNKTVFTALQTKLKVGNRRGVHLNAIPASSRYKLDIARLAAIFKSLPERFILDLTTLRNVKFTFSTHDRVLTGKETPEQLAKNEEVLQKLVGSIETLIFQNEVIASEKGVNTLGFGFPILLRRDNADGQLTAAPILIWSVKMKPTTQMNTWEISRTEDDPIYLNEVLANHLQTDSGITLPPIPDEMLEDGKIDKPELFALCNNLLSQLKATQNLDFLLNNYAEILPLKSKAEYEELLPNKGDVLIEKCGILSLFEVQKQNIINDYDKLINSFQSEEFPAEQELQTLSSVPTDPSQQHILEQLRQQRKILIQGPPGTGKSQTLTAILINALQNKQKTLVVCEKQTALEVLYNALQQKGLGKYCTMIKDAIADRRFIVEAVRNTIDAADFRKEVEGYPQQALTTQVEAMNSHKGHINAIHHKMNTPLVGGNNWTNIVGALMSYQTDAQEVNLSALSFSFNEDEWQLLTPLWQEGERLWADFKPFSLSPLFSPEKLTAQNLYTTQQAIAESFKNYQQQYEAIGKLADNYRQEYEQLRKNEFAQQLSTLSAAMNQYELITAILSPTNEVFHPERTNSFFYKLSALFSGEKKKTLRTQKQLEALSTEIKAISLHPNFSPINITADLWQNKTEIAQYSSAVAQAQAQFNDKVTTDFASLDLLNYIQPQFSTPALTAVVSAVKALIAQLQSDGWLHTPFTGHSFADFNAFIAELFSTYQQHLQSDAQGLKAAYQWYSWYLQRNTFQQQCIPLLQKVEHWEASFLTAYYPLLLRHNADDSLNFGNHHYTDFLQLLKGFALTQQSFIEGYWNAQQRKAVKAFEEKNKELTVANLYNKRKSEKHNRLPLRQIAMTDTDLFTTFFPIVLTTPDACCNLFEGKNFYFDNVVFDEASQLKLEDNLPAMLKGKTVVIAGDEHQMPPSNYFSKVFDGSADDEDEEVTEDETLTYKEAMLNIESLLDYALEFQFSKNHLDFHYRSRHPHLIDFSNHAFYNARLRPLPTTHQYTPIEFRQIEGVFEEHINKEEAAEVLKVLESITPRPDGSYPSVGIATFNITQRNYIRKQLLLKQNADEAFREKLALLEGAGLFIKNLENIQGDERDIIILSVTYGKKHNGKFVQSFGPLNHTKGYKLLNVIITRAKEKIYVCNSIPEEVWSAYKEALATEGANNRRAVLYAYLAYCQAVSTDNEALRQEILSVLDRYGHKHTPTDANSHNLFKEQVYQQLKAQHPDKDITLDYHFGGYTIDILLKPTTGTPIAIECLSKPLYHDDLAYLEDLHKEKILKAAGFEYQRKWAFTY